MQGQLVNERYRIDKAIGRGGMAIVYKAFDITLSRPVAIKILHGHFTHNAHFIERFRREAFAAASLIHPNITTIYDTGYSNGIYYIVMEYINGKTLKQVIEQRSPLPIHEAVDIARQVAEAVGHAHSRSIIHRDIKPQNIMIADDYIVKVTDFGIARALTMPGLTQTGKILGTARYISPEQARGQQADHRSDMYSIGIILYETVTGRAPFEGDSSVEVAGKHVTEKPIRPYELNPKIPPVLEIIIDKLLKKDPNDRYQDINRLLEDLAFWESPQRKDFLADFAEEAKTERRAERAKSKDKKGTKPGRDRRRKKLTVFAKLLIALSIVVVMGALLYFAFFSGSGEATVAKHPKRAGSKGRFEGEKVGKLKPLQLVDYDPTGDGDENPGQVDKIMDKNPATAWSTESYRSATFGGQKDGVGVYMAYGRDVEVQKLAIDSCGGWSGAIKGSDDALNWKSLKEIKNADKKLSFELGGEAYKYYLIWIDRLVPLGAGKYGCKIYEVEARGRVL